MQKDYTYAVARIRGNELNLLTQASIDQLLGCGSYREAIDFLLEKGWGNPEEEPTAENILEAETNKTWKLIGELTDDMSAFDVLRIADDYHNLKAAIKLDYTKSNLDPSRLFENGGTIDWHIMEQAAAEHDFAALPDEMAAAAAEAQNTLLHTGDGQMCDAILDRASLEAVYAAGKKAKNEVIRDYASLTVMLSDIKIALRCGLVGKSYEFTIQGLAECDELDIKALAHAALNGKDGVVEYLSSTAHADAAEALKESPASFERWCDNLIIEHIKPQKYDTFTIGPLVAYVLARENEIKCVRMVLTGKQNDLPDEIIRERLREMYV